MDERFISERIAQLRTQADVSARELSLTLGQSTGYINTIERGQSLPSMGMFLVICDHFKITPQEFFNDDMDYPMLTKNLLKDINGLNDKQLENISAIIKDMKKK